MSTDAVSTGKPLGIVVAADGSPASRVAVDWAARDAELRGGHAHGRTCGADRHNGLLDGRTDLGRVLGRA